MTRYISPGCCPKSYGTIVWKLANTRDVFQEGSTDAFRNPGIRGPERTGWAVYTLSWRTFQGRTIYQMRAIDRCECGADLTKIPKEQGVEFRLDCPAEVRPQQPVAEVPDKGRCP